MFDWQNDDYDIRGITRKTLRSQGVIRNPVDPGLASARGMGVVTDEDYPAIMETANRPLPTRPSPVPETRPERIYPSRSVVGYGPEAMVGPPLLEPTLAPRRSTEPQVSIPPERPAPPRVISEPTQPAPAPSPARGQTPQERLEELEAIYPTGPAPTGVLPIGAGPMQTMRFGDREYTVPMSTVSEAVTASQGQGRMGSRFEIPEQMSRYFDDMIKSIMEPSETEKTLRLQSEGWGLRPGESVRGRETATKQLAQLDASRRTAISHLANTLSGLMMEPSRFQRDIMGKEMQYDIGLRGAETARRRADVEEAKAPWEIEKIRRQGPDTITGYEGAEHVTKAWNPRTETYETVTRGVLPINVPREGKVIDPVSGRVIAEGTEGTRFTENLGRIAFKSYYDQLKNIEDDPFLSEEQKEMAKNQAWGRMTGTMGKLGHGKYFEQQGAGTGPTIEGFKQAAKAQGSKMSDEQLEQAFQERYGAAQ